MYWSFLSVYIASRFGMEAFLVLFAYINPYSAEPGYILF